ncbi:proline-specific peptidase [Pholiota conissans]|uniref:Proline-specific peptidase n=1 Tax=Pholiota conissans TaxID=109636 RepID=A0A9P6CNU0_9AGAR|nr:proline-specific peptidase [Pholiota conissans]
MSVYYMGSGLYRAIVGTIGWGRLLPEWDRNIIALHGGPGMSHHYMLPNQTLYHQAGIPVILYDQIGNGASSHRRDAPKEFWVPSLFMDELDNLAKALGIHEDFDLLGQSWGGMLAAEYAASHTPKGLKRLIIANSPASIELCTVGMNDLLSRFPEEFVKTVRTHEANGTTDSEEYQKASMEFYKKHTCTTDPWPQELLQSFEEFAKDPTVYHTMLGPSEFTTTGNLKTWDITGIIHKIECPTLLISAPLDEIQEVAVVPFFQKIPKVKWVELQNSTHLAQFEEPEKYFKTILNFLDHTEVQ